MKTHVSKSDKEILLWGVCNTDLGDFDIKSDEIYMWELCLYLNRNLAPQLGYILHIWQTVY